MNERQINLVKMSFAKIESAAEEAGVLFYVKLFKLDPSLRGLFNVKMNEQGGKLIQTIGYAVAALDRMEELIPVVQALGVRHASYGVEDRHYDTVGTALLWTLGVALKEDFTVETEEAWATVYDLLAQTMMDAARSQAENSAAA